MSRKIFITYKYSDTNIRAISGVYKSTVRDYVDILQSKLDSTNHVYLGEDDGEDLSSLADSTIGSKLGDKIFESTVTIVFISKGMRENKPDKEQWIPWEVSYSLREQSRVGRTSKTNAVLAVVLPDRDGSYEYFVKYNPESNRPTYETNLLFDILRENMFNIIKAEKKICNGMTIFNGYSSYIYPVKWDTFINKPLWIENP